MKMTELISLAQSGQPVAVAEYRSREVRDQEWLDKQTGRLRRGTFCHDNIELHGKPVKVKVRLEDGVTADSAAAKSPFKPGQKVALVVTQYVEEKGNLSASGDLEPITD